MEENQKQSNDNKMIYKKIKETKYKFIVFLVALAIFLGWGYFDSSFDRVESKEDTKQQEMEEKNNLENEINRIKEEIDFFEKISQNSEEVVECINLDVCDDLEEELAEFIEQNEQLVRKYILLSPLGWEKMDYDQKLILRNIYFYLLDWGEYWDLNSISFWQLEDASEKLKKLPVRLNIDFENEQNFFEFLDNMEKKITYQDSVFYDVETVNYDIVWYQEPQSVSVNSNIYFYK